MRAEFIIALAVGSGTIGSTLLYIGGFLSDIKNKAMTKKDCKDAHVNYNTTQGGKLKEVKNSISKIEKRINSDVKCMQTDIKYMETIQEDRIEKIHLRIDQVLKAINRIGISVAEMKGQMKSDRDHKDNKDG